VPQVRCPSCRHENPADSTFCEGCGAKLGLRCPRCGAEASGEARFCRKCGSLVQPAEGVTATPSERRSAADAAAPSSSDAERRQLTVLFCDLVGSTRLAAGLDPEDWREVVRRYQEASERTWRRGLELAERLGDDSSRASALAGISVLHQTRSELEKAMRFASDLRDLGIAGADHEAELAGWQVLISCHLMLGELEAGVGALDRCLECDPALEADRSWGRYGFSLRVAARSWGGWALWIRGHAERASALLDGTVALARRARHPISLCFALAYVAASSSSRGSPPKRAGSAKSSSA
jgi:ribosomal protein L40E